MGIGKNAWRWMFAAEAVPALLFFVALLEVNHGPFIVANNLFLSELSLRDWSEGGAYIHNLFAGNLEVRPQDRFIPFHKPHPTGLAGQKQTVCGDNRFFNNIFVGGTPEENQMGQIS